MRHRGRRGVARSLGRGSSEVFYWELFVFRRPFIFLQKGKWMSLLWFVKIRSGKFVIGRALALI
jgi:hypothetical protein